MQKTVESLLEDYEDESRITPAPASFRSRLYTSLIHEAQRSAPLRPLSATADAGYAICEWENLTRHLPRGEVTNHCTVCHARVFAEIFDSLAMPWDGCPYHKLHSR